MKSSEVDQLGNRLRGLLTVTDLRALDDYRRRFRNDYDTVVGRIRETLHVETSGRPAKSTTAIVDKLRRGTMRLTQMQDIAGCRIIVPTIAEQDTMVISLERLFPVSISDRREKPSHGYRAVHIIAKPHNKHVEIQVRTMLQHLWAELSEKLADTYDPKLKYGEGPDHLRLWLNRSSQFVARFEAAEVKNPGSASLLELKVEIQTTFSQAMEMFQDKL